VAAQLMSAPKNPNTQIQTLAVFAQDERNGIVCIPPQNATCFERVLSVLPILLSSNHASVRPASAAALSASQSDAYQAVACFRTRWPAQPGLEANINGAGHGPLPRGFAPMTNMHIDTQAKSKQLTAQRETLIIPAM
jgi:hypothetical protein